MPRESKSARLKRIHEEALREFDDVHSASIDERRQCQEDRRFVSIAGAQWEGPLGDQLEGRPKMEFNKVQMSVVRIINEKRNSNIGISFVPREADAEADDNLADLCAGLLRADEYDSGADEAYDNAFEEGATGGMGAALVRADFVDEDDEADERQRICIEPIYDADTSVFFDLNAKRQDKSDAKRCWVIKAMSRDAYKDEYDCDPSSWPKDTMQTRFDWSTPDVVYICDYYRLEKVKKTFEVWKAPGGEVKEIGPDDHETDEDYEADVAEMQALGWVLDGEKRREVKEIRKYMLDGAGVLDDSLLVGSCIPVVPYYGKRWYIDNVERMAGVARYIKDAQRLKNMQLSKLAETAALSGREKPIFMAEQIAGHEVAWSEDNLRDFPYLVVNGFDASGNPLPVGPQAYTKPPQVPPAMAALIQQSEMELREILGSPEQAEKLMSGVSGKAVEMIQTRVDGLAAIYLTNFSKFLRRIAKVWLGMAAEVYVEPKRKVRVMSEDGEASFKEINKPKLGRSGELLEGVDLDRAKFDVYADVGPSSQSSRQATVRALTNMMTLTQDPEDLKILTSMAMMNIEGEGLGDVRPFFRKRLVSMGAVEPTEEERTELEQAAQAQKPDPQAAFLETEGQKNMAQAQKYAAETRETVAKTAKTEAETVKILGDARRPVR
jgi:hypothetical protein